MWKCYGKLTNLEFPTLLFVCKNLESWSFPSSLIEKIFPCWTRQLENLFFRPKSFCHLEALEYSFLICFYSIYNRLKQADHFLAILATGEILSRKVLSDYIKCVTLSLTATTSLTSKDTLPDYGTIKIAKELTSHLQALRVSRDNIFAYSVQFCLINSCN